MKILEPNIDSIFNIKNSSEFNELALQVFNYQYHTNIVYQEFVNLLKVNPNEVKEVEQIPFLPIAFFKSHKVVSTKNHEAVFKSSGTTGQVRSAHYVSDLSIYQKSFIDAFIRIYGDFKEYCFLGLLPSYLEQGESSLVYMANHFIENTLQNGSAFYLNNHQELAIKMGELEKEKKKYILIGVSYALLDFIEKYPQQLSTGIVMETGGMKGRRKEMTKTELHNELKNGFGINKINSEYGMTELLSQAYSLGNEMYQCPPWMKVVTRSTSDPFQLQNDKRGLMNIIDLANIHSCSFIATDDLGLVQKNGEFKVLGRFDYADVRGCNLMVN